MGGSIELESDPHQKGAEFLIKLVAGRKSN
jgi:hypothetical protein